MPSEDEQNKERSKVSLRIGEVQVELEGTSNNIKKLMDKELFEFTKKLEETTKPLPSSTEVAPQVTPKAPEVTPKEITVSPPSKPSTASEVPSKKSRFFAREKKTEKVSKRKIGWKPLAIVLVMVCIVLSAGLIGVIAVYLPMVNDLEAQVAEKDINITALNSTISSLNSQVSGLQANLTRNENYIENLEYGVDVLNSQIQSYLNILSLNASAYLVLPETPFTQNASAYSVIFQNLVEYAGYVGVSVQSTSNTTYVQLLYSYKGVNYDHNVTVTTSGTASFPVLPGGIEIRLGNTDPSPGDSVNATVTAVYYY